MVTSSQPVNNKPQPKRLGRRMLVRGRIVLRELRSLRSAFGVNLQLRPLHVRVVDQVLPPIEQRADYKGWLLVQVEKEGWSDDGFLRDPETRQRGAALRRFSTGKATRYTPRSMHPAIIGPFRIERELGRGGIEVKGGNGEWGGWGKRANVQGTESGHAEWLYWAFVVGPGASDQGNLGLRE